MEQLDIMDRRELAGIENAAPPTHGSVTYFPRPSKTKRVYGGIKRAFDVVASCMALVLSSPIFLLVAIGIKLEDGGPVFYSHTRIGMDGKKIKLWKFRSMRQNADDLTKMLTPEQLEQYYREFKVDCDPRITKLGSILRRTSLDELPQLVNILNNTLSLVGPRPVVEDELKYYGDTLNLFLSVKPGLTGYWQAYARNDAGYSSGKRQEMELFYCTNRSLWLDLKILFKTVEAVFRQRGVQ